MHTFPHLYDVESTKLLASRHSKVQYLPNGAYLSRTSDASSSSSIVTVFRLLQHSGRITQPIRSAGGKLGSCQLSIV